MELMECGMVYNKVVFNGSLLARYYIDNVLVLIKKVYYIMFFFHFRSAVIIWKCP